MKNPGEQGFGTQCKRQPCTPKAGRVQQPCHLGRESPEHHCLLHIIASCLFATKKNSPVPFDLRSRQAATLASFIRYEFPPTFHPRSFISRKGALNLLFESDKIKYRTRKKEPQEQLHKQSFLTAASSMPSTTRGELLSSEESCFLP